MDEKLEAAEPGNIPRRRWYSFSLRTLLILVTLAGCGLGWLGMKVASSMAPIQPLVGPAILLIIAVLLGLQYAIVGSDRKRIERSIEERGGKFLSHTRPFGLGLFGSQCRSIYIVRYLDSDRKEHEAHCKASFWTSEVYFSGDQVVGSAEKPSQDVSRSEIDLEAENRRLREELEQVRRQQDSA